MLEAAVNDFSALHFASDELKRDKALVLEAVRSCGVQLQDAAYELRSDTAVMQAAGVQHDLGSFTY